MKTKYLVITVLGAIGVGALAFFVTNKKKSGKPGIIGSIFGTPDTSGDYEIDTDSFPLKRGSKGPKVAALQRFLNTEEAAGLDDDGDFGPLTEKAWLNNQLCDIVPNTKTSCWKNFKQHWPNAVPGQVDKDFYNQLVKPFEN